MRQVFLERRETPESSVIDCLEERLLGVLSELVFGINIVELLRMGHSQSGLHGASSELAVGSRRMSLYYL